MPLLSDLQKRTAQAIVNIFETGRVQGEHGRVTLMPGDSGHLTYGRSQTTLASGNLHILIRDYCGAPGAQYAAGLHPYLAALDACDITLDTDLAFHELLRRAGDDPVMREVQDAFFDRIYWAPTLASADYIGAATPLGTSIIYDARIHGAWHALRDRTIEAHGQPKAIGEQTWLRHYVVVRRDWLANHSNTLLRKTVYRMESFNTLIAADKWDLDLPITVRGVVIDEAAFAAPPPSGGWAGGAAEVVLKLRQPNLQGLAVRRLQRALADAGIAVPVTGVFDAETDRAVRAYQQREGLKADGIVGPATWAALAP